MHFIQEQHSGRNLRLALLPPLRHLGVDLVPDLGLDLPGIAGEEGEEALGPRVDDVDLVQGDCVHNLATLLQLALGTLYKSGVSSLKIKMIIISKQ